MMISKNNLKLKLFERYFKYEYDSKIYKLKLLIGEKDNELRDFEKANFRKIMMIKDDIITLEDNSFIWYVKSCDHCFANEIVFTIEYAIELYNDDTKYSSIELKSLGLSSLLHPSNYFYHNREASKGNVLYNVIKMKEFKFDFDNEEIEACIYIGNLLNCGILSNLTNDVILSLKFSETKNILKICKMIDHARTSLRILSYSNLFQFSSIELKGSNNQYVGRIAENQIPNIHYITIGKSNNLYFNNIMEKVFNNIYNLDVSKLKFINYDYSMEEYYIILINLFSVFESNFKIKFKEYRVAKFDDDQLSTINQCVLFLNQLKENNNSQGQFIESLKNRIEIYNNSLYNKLKYALDYYCKKLVEENKIPLISTRVEWLYYKTLFDKADLENKNVEMASQRLYQLRNEFVHDSKMPALNKLEEFWITAFQTIVYAMILDNLGLNDSEIAEHLGSLY